MHGDAHRQHAALPAAELGYTGPLSPMRISAAGPPGLVLSYARLAPRHSPEAVTRLELAVHAVLTEDRCLSATAIPADNEQWHLTSAGWPAAPEDFYP